MDKKKKEDEEENKKYAEDVENKDEDKIEKV